jgi:putative endopeptidase
MGQLLLMAELTEKPIITSDFYTHVNWDWLNSNPIPNEYTKWGNFNVLNEKNQHRLKEMLESNPSPSPNPNPSPNSNPELTDQEKLNILWSQGLNEHELNKQGHTHLLKLFDKFKLNSDIDTIIIELMKYNLCFLFDISAYTDKKDSSKNILYWDVMGLGLPDRDYYLLDSMRDKRDGYKEFLTKFINHFSLESIITPDQIYNFEEKVAKVRLSKTDRRDPTKTYNIYSFEKLCESFPGINWIKLFEAFNIPINDSTNDLIVVTEPEFFKFISGHLQSAKLNGEIMEELIGYLKYKLLKYVGSNVDDTTYMILFNFYAKQLYGQKEPKQRWKRSLGTVESILGEVLSKAYVEKYFGQDQKTSCVDMIQEIIKTYRERLEQLDWMSEETKAKALEKLSKMTIKIGFPDKWTDFSKLDINSNNLYYENMLEAGRWELEHNLEKLYKPVDKLEWHMNAHNINAYYSPSNNEIVFPAGILQEPFYSSTQSIAENLGGIGAVIGHEITHGFDDKGRLFDSNGNLNDWWTEDDAKRFEERSKKLENHFNKFSFFDIGVNGKLTMGENIADLGGITFSLKTLERLTKPEDKENQIRKLFEQWAKIWRCNITDDALKNQLLTDPHSPTKLRVNAILPNLDEFHKVYNIKVEDELFLDPELRSNIW